MPKGARVDVDAAAVAAADEGAPFTSDITIRKACVIRKRMKIGSRNITESFTPRKFMIMSRPTPAMTAAYFHSFQASGRKLKMASAPDATEIATVRM